MVSKPPLTIEEQIEKGVSILKKGGLVAYPTDTVYGLGAGTAFTRAVERIYEVKQRPVNMPLPLLLADVSQVAGVAAEVSYVARLLIKNFFPGALTMVLPASPSVPDIVTAGGKTVAVRVPAHSVTISLIKGLGMPLVGTSANLSGKPSPLSAEEVYSQIGDKIDYIVDGGRCPGGKESTIIDVSAEKPVILREGAINIEQIREFYPDIMLEKED